MSLSEKVEQLNREISAAVERALSEMRRELSQRMRAHSDDFARHVESFSPQLPGVFLAHEDLAPAAETLRSAAVKEARQDLLGTLRESLSAIDRARTQAEILGALLEGASRFAERAALLLLRDGELRGWDGRGWHEAEPAIAQLRLQPDGAWAHLAAGQHGYRLTTAESALLCSRLESPLPQEAVLLPLILRDRVAAALYADRLDGAPGSPGAPGDPGDPGEHRAEIEVEALQLLTHGAAQAIETLAFRERSSTATLANLAAAGAGAPVSLPEPAEAPPQEAEPEQPSGAAGAAPATEELHRPAQPPAGQPAAEQVTVPVAHQAAGAEAEPAAEHGGVAGVRTAQPAEPSQHAAPMAEEHGWPPAAEPTARGAWEQEPAPASSSAGSAAEAAEPAEHPAEPVEAAAEPAASPVAGAHAQAEPAPSETAAAAPAHPEGGTELPGSPADRPAFLDDSLAYSARHTTELPMPAVPAEGSESTAALPLEDMAAGRTPLPQAEPEGSRSAQVEHAGGDDGRNDTVLLPRPGFREAVPPSWARPARREAEEAEEKSPETLEARETTETRETPETPETPEIVTRGKPGFAAAHGEQAASPPPPEPPPGRPAESFQTTLTPVAPLAAESSSPAGAARADAGSVTHPDVGRAETAPTPLPSGVFREPATAAFEPLRSTPLTSGTPEVRPPTGVQGPGWAFATTRLATSSEESAHEEARRLARLLVSEIKLYNEEQVEAGRRNRDIYERLREDIDRSRQMYEERVEPRLAKSTDYFYQELVRILAAGDSKALGI